MRGISALTCCLTSLSPCTGRRSPDASAILREMQRLEQARLKKRSCQQALAQMRRYEEHCTKLRLPAYPPSYDSVGSYLVGFVQRNQGSTKSLANVKSHLKTMATRKGLGWLSPTEAARLTALEAELRLEDHGGTERKLPLTMRLLVRIIGQLDLTVESELLAATLMAMGHDGLLRGGELCSGLRKEDFVWWADGSGVSLLLQRTKTHRSGGAVKVDIPDHELPFSAVKLLRRWWERRRLGEMPDRTIVFPDVVGRSQTFGEGTISLDWVRNRIKAAVAKLGLDPKRYSGHSMRAGGATDLFVARVPYHIIKKMGRWSTDAAMIYYRADEDVRRSVRRAFSRVARNL